MKYGRWSIEPSEDDFDSLMRLYRPEPSQVSYRDAVGIEELMGMRLRREPD